MKAAIIGYGSMGRMLLCKFSAAGLDRDSLFVSSRTREKLSEAQSIAIPCTNAEAAERSDIVFLCVRPGDMKGIIEEIAPHLGSHTLLVSLNGSITFDMISAVCRHKTAKVIPSVTAEIDRSQTLVCYNELVEKSDRTALEGLLGTFGSVTVLPESDMAMGSELVSCMPGFIAAIADVICNEAKEHTDIPYERIVQMVMGTVAATGELCLEKGLSFSDIVGRVATKGGITAEGTAVIYDSFPDTAAELFRRTLEKRRITAERAAECFR